ncbi:Pleckstrin y domain [Balamuthia mandrillaris]
MEKQLRTLLSQTEGATLDLSNLSLKAQDVDALVSLLLNDKQFRSIKLNGYHIGDEGAIHLSRLLLHQRSSGPLLRLSLSAGGEGRHTLELVEAERRDIGERGGLALARALCFNSSLERLDLQNNSLRATGNPSSCPAVQLMARALSVNQYLTHLDLSGNKLSSEEVIILANSWRRNHALVKVSFAKSRINKPCHIFIADCLKTNAVMEVVDFKGSATASYSLSDVCQIYIDMLAVNTTLLEIKLPAPLAVREDAHKAKQMAELLERNRRMTKEREALYKRQAQMGSSRLTGSMPTVTNSGRMSLDKISTARSGDYEGRGRATNSGRFPRVNSSSSSPVPLPADSRRGSYSSSFSSSFDPATGDGPPAAASLLIQRKGTIDGEGGKKMTDDGAGESSDRSRSESLQEQDNSSSSEDVNNTNKRPERQMVLAKLGSAFSGTATDLKDVSTCVLYELAHEPLDRIDISRMNLRTFSMEDVEYIVAHHGDLIKELFLFHNRLKELPRNIGKLRGLTVLDLCGNHISNLPNELDCMCSLQRLDLSHNKLKDLPSLPSLTQLRRVFLNHNDFANLPEAIMNLTGLRTLDVSFNNIKVLPPSIANLQELKYFYLENNQLTTICREIGALTNLLELRLEYNRLEFLPVELAHIPSLKKICLRGNPLSTITGRLDPKSNKKNNNTEDLIERVGASLASTSSPTSFYFPTSSSSSSSSSSSHKDKNHSSSDLTSANERESEKERKENNVGDKESGDDSDADNDLKWVRAYLHSLEEQSKSFMRVKLMLVGEGGVGKTSLLRCFREKKKSKEKNPNIATDGIDIADTQWANISFRAWDFAGQDLYQTTHQFFLSKRSIYLLVFNLADAYRESTRKLDYWLYSLKARVPGVPVVIVGTHLDHKALQPKKKKGGDAPVADILEKISKRYKRRFPNVADIVAVSCKTKRGIKELKSKIATVAEKKKFVRLTIPSPFLIFSKFVTVLAMPGSFLYPPITKKAKFRKQAKSFNVEDGEFEDLLIFLNDIGDIAYFGDDPSEELSDYVFLGMLFSFSKAALSEAG